MAKKALLLLLTVALMLATLSNYVREAAVLKEEADYTL